MSASFPQVAFWVIFPLAALVVLSGWALVLAAAVRKLRARKRQERARREFLPLEAQGAPGPGWTDLEDFSSGAAPDALLN